MRRAVVLHRNQIRQRARRVSRRDVHRDRRIAERQLLAVCGHHVARRTRAAAAVEEIPVGGRQQHARLVAVLQILRAARMVAVAVADDHVLDLGRVEADLLQSFRDLIVDGVVEERVDDDDPLGCGDGPGRELRHAEEVEVVEDFHRLGVPRLLRRRSRRRRRRCAARRTGAASARPTRHCRAQRREQHAVILFRRSLGRRDVRVDLGALRVHDQRQCRGHHRNKNDLFRAFVSSWPNPWC